MSVTVIKTSNYRLVDEPIIEEVPGDGIARGPVEMVVGYYKVAVPNTDGYFKSLLDVAVHLCQQYQLGPVEAVMDAFFEDEPNDIADEAFRLARQLYVKAELVPDGFEPYRTATVWVEKAMFENGKAV